jgi:F-type H+-transporting ATPase subunit delta
MNLKKSEINSLAERYANAIFTSSLEDANQFLEFTKAANDNDGFKKIVNNPVSDKSQILGLISSLNFSEKLSNFLKIIVENKRLFLIADIAEKLSKIIRKNNNQEVAEVYSVKKLSDDSIKQISEQLKKVLNKDIVVENKIDKSVLGGLKIKVGSVLFDDSLATKLQRLKVEFGG